MSGKGAGLFGGILFGLSGFLQLLAIFWWTPHEYWREYFLAIIWGCGFLAGLLISSGLSGYGTRGKDLNVLGGLFIAAMISMTIAEFLLGTNTFAIGVSFGSAILAFIGIFLATAQSGRRY